MDSVGNWRRYNGTALYGTYYNYKGKFIEYGYLYSKIKHKVLKESTFSQKYIKYYWPNNNNAYPT